MRFLLFFKTSASPRPSERNIGTASYWFCLHFPQIEKSGTRHRHSALLRQREIRGKEMWPVLAAITLAMAIGFSVLALEVEL
jgi:hypothetical protein